MNAGRAALYRQHGILCVQRLSFRQLGYITLQNTRCIGCLSIQGSSEAISDVQINMPSWVLRPPCILH